MTILLLIPFSMGNGVFYDYCVFDGRERPALSLS